MIRSQNRKIENMYLKIVSLKRDGTDGSIFLMTTTKCTIGKSNNCLLRVKENDVQDIHCEVYTEDGQVRPLIFNRSGILGNRSMNDMLLTLI